MKPIRAFIPLVLALLVAACAPGVSSGGVDQDSNFNASVNGTPVAYADGAWRYANNASGYVLTFDLPAFSDDALFVLDPRAAPGVDYINVSVENTGELPLQLVWNQSSIVLPSGNTSQVINGETRFINADQGSTPSVIPPGGRLSDMAVPASNVFYLDGYEVAPIYDTAQARQSTFRLFLTLDRGGELLTADIAFRGKGVQ